jgi:hypothetical protein
MLPEIQHVHAGVVKLAITAVFKTAILAGICGFESHRPHSFYPILFLPWPSPRPRLAHACDFPEVFGPAFGRSLSAKLAEGCGRLDGEEMVSQHHRIAQEFLSTLCAALGEFRRGIEEGLGFRDHAAERFQVLPFWHDSTLPQKQAPAVYLATQRVTLPPRGVVSWGALLEGMNEYTGRRINRFQVQTHGLPCFVKRCEVEKCVDAIPVMVAS